ncbi:MAG: hypothetical protein KC729_20840, partial [Candidatus Eisenbacteria bacterium]|nr:hypothetical protein [Candidatus Eisenbacteria bacterium]
MRAESPERTPPVMNPQITRFRLALLVLAGGASPVLAQGLPPAPVPPQNPITEEKRVLGKILFWDEQLSSDGSMACGTCHRFGAGGADGRVGQHPGFDLVLDTPDDILGSPGIRHADSDGDPIVDPLFGTDPQVTARTAQTLLGAPYAPNLFWDGRASGTFVDPETGSTLIPLGGGLESQAIAPILNDAEMAYEDRTWSDVEAHLMEVVPLALVSDVPPDMAAAIAQSPTYPALFTEAFGDPAITASRIAFAIATYERTLTPDQTPWDQFVNGNPGALTQQQRRGWDFFRNSPCSVCHRPPVFSDGSFRNIGLRPPVEDNGRQGVTGVPQDRGRFKVPSLRDVGQRDRLMHTGQITDVADALSFYQRLNGHVHFPENQDPAVRGGIPIPANLAADVEDFLVNGLTDPRVANETFPFDRPTLGEPEPAGLGDDDAQDTAPVADMSTIAAQAFPNPFRDDVTIRFQLESAS